MEFSNSSNSIPPTDNRRLVYIPHDTVGWKAGEVLQYQRHSDYVSVSIHPDPHDPNENEGQNVVVSVPNNQLKAQNTIASYGSGCDDMVNLTYLHEPAILFNLRTRFLARRPYTNTGSIVVSVNPYEWHDDLYTSATQAAYLQDNVALPPHIYKTSATAYRNLSTTSCCENQSIVVTGESGAGKTEAVKLLMHHLALAGTKSNSSNTKNVIIQRILDSNPLLEAFGNASTSRNDNSSRFGKFTKLLFNSTGSRLIGAQIQTYLLESARVMSSSSNCCNYHIFYQLIGTSLEFQRKIGINHDITCFPCIASSTSANEGNLDKTKDALDTIGVSDSDQQALFEAIVSILYISRIEFKAEDSLNEDAGVSISECVDTVNHIASLLGLASPPSLLTQTLCKRKLLVGCGETYDVPLTVNQALAASAALGTIIYRKIFTWLIAKINESCSSTIEKAKVINILDIFGFESFAVNSFEQLCINYANEKLQERFTTDVITDVQAEYESEGLDLTLEDDYCYDSDIVLRLIESSVLPLLNDECKHLRGSDEAFVRNLSRASTNYRKVFSVPLIDSTKHFSITHFAGTVRYTSQNFVVKNRDVVSVDIIQLLESSSKPWISNLFKNRRRMKTSSYNKTVSAEFKNQLQELMTDISKTNVQYIRCIKPNDSQDPKSFSKYNVMQQLRYAGVIDAIRISRAVYPNRVLQNDFISRFKILGNSVSTISSICNALNLETNSFKIGLTRIYFAAGVLEKLEYARNRRMNNAAVIIQSRLKAYCVTKVFHKTIKCIIIIQRIIRKSRARQVLWKRITSRVVIQCAVRRWIICKKQRSLKKNAAALIIQAKYKSVVQHQKYQQTLGRIKLIQKRFRERKKEVVKIALIESKEHESTIATLQRENRKLKNANRNLKAFIAQLRFEKRELEANNNINIQLKGLEVSKVLKENEELREAHERIKVAHRLLKEQNLIATKSVAELQEQVARV